MKKRLLIALAAGAVLSACATTAFTVRPANKSVSADAGATDVFNNTGSITVEVGEDFICNGGNNFVDADGDGVCDNKGSGQGNGKCGKNFVDEDGDGVCDNKGSGQGNGKCGKNFVDEDGDGVCDNKGAGQGNGKCGSANGHGKGRRGGCGN